MQAHATVHFLRHATQRIVWCRFKRASQVLVVQANGRSVRANSNLLCPAVPMMRLDKRSCANTRLMRDLSRLMRSDTEKLGFSLQLKNDDALNEWNINLFGFSDCPLAEVRESFTPVGVRMGRDGSSVYNPRLPLSVFLEETPSVFWEPS